MAAAEITNLLSNANVTDVKGGISARYWFRVGSYIMEAMGELSLAVATILLALEGPLANATLKYCAIGLNVAAIALRLLKSYSLRESRNRTLEINIITKKLGIEELPDIVLDQELLTTRGFNPSAARFATNANSPPRVPPNPPVVPRPAVSAPPADAGAFELTNA